MLATIAACKIRNFSIFLKEPENLLFAYWEYHGSDFAADAARMAADPVTRDWWALTDPCQALKRRALGERRALFFLGDLQVLEQRGSDWLQDRCRQEFRLRTDTKPFLGPLCRPLSRPFLPFGEPSRSAQLGRTKCWMLLCPLHVDFVEEPPVVAAALWICSAVSAADSCLFALCGEDRRREGDKLRQFSQILGGGG